ncbi:MAG: hypothetical protein ABI572_05260 [Actinomycetota bacterium]
MRKGFALVLAVSVALLPGVAIAGPYSPDPSYQADAVVRDAKFGNGAIYLGGEFTHMRPAGAAAGTNEVVRNHAAAIDAGSGALLSWNPNVNGTVYGVLVDGDTVYLAGKFTSVDGASRTNLAAVDATTAAVKSWNPRAAGVVRTIVKGPNGNLFIGGGFGSVNGQSRRRLAEITPSGSVTSWSVNVGQVSGFACPPRCQPTVFTIDFSDDGGTVFFGGHFGLVNGVSRNEVAAVSINNGSTLLPWDPDVYAPANCPDCQTNETSRVYHLIITSNKAYMCGGFWNVWNQSKRAFNILVTNLTTGQPDPTFAAGDDGDTPGCELRGGVLYFGGHFNYVGPICSPNPPAGRNATKCTADNGSITRHHVAAVDATTGQLLGWNANANSNHGVWSIQSGPNGQMAFTGYFTTIGGSKQQMIAKYSASHLI